MPAREANSTKTFMARLVPYWRALLYMGVKEGASVKEVHRTLIINVILVVVTPLLFYFCCVNFLQHRYLLGALNTANLIIYLSLLWSNYRQRWFWTRIPLLIGLAIIFGLEALWFKNGGEYFLLMIALSAVVVFDSKWRYFLFSILLVGAFVWIRIEHTPEQVGEELSRARVMVNLLASGVAMVITAQYFKTMVYNYQLRLEESNKQLAEANTTMQKMFSVIAHDLRSPITALHYSMTLLNDETITEEEFRFFSGKLNVQVGQLQANLDNLLRWSLTQLQGIEAKPRVVPAEEAITSVIDFFGEMLAQKNVQVNTDLTPGISLYTDPDHFALILRNLLSNAVKFSYPGSVITLSLRQSLKQAFISVQDRGTGITEQLRKQLFTGKQGNSLSGTKNEKGTGLGLLLCKEFAEKNGSSIQVESTPGKGSTFIYSIPLAL